MVGGAVVLLACLAWALYGAADVLPPYLVGILAGVASGAAMLPYTVIKEANPVRFSGMATGVINFINFTFSALLAPVFGWLLQKSTAGEELARGHFQMTFSPMLLGVGVAILLIFALKETGPAAHRA
jgi:MFS family permease